MTSQRSRQKTQSNKPNLWLVHIAQNQQINGQLQVELLQKLHHFSNGSTSGFKYEELIDDWLDLTVLEAEKRGRALKNRLVRDAEMHKELLNRESLRAENGVKYFKDTLRLHFMKGTQSVFFWRFYRFSNARMGNIANSLMDQLRTVFPQTFLRSPQCLTAHVQPQSALSTSCPKQ